MMVLPILYQGPLLEILRRLFYSNERKYGSVRWKLCSLPHWIQAHKLVDLGFICSPFASIDKRIMVKLLEKD